MAVLVVTGSPGAGKSAVITALQELRLREYGEVWLHCPLDCFEAMGPCASQLSGTQLGSVIDSMIRSVTALPADRVSVAVELVARLEDPASMAIYRQLVMRFAETGHSPCTVGIRVGREVAGDRIASRGTRDHDKDEVGPLADPMQLPPVDLALDSTIASAADLASEIGRFLASRVGQQG